MQCMDILVYNSTCQLSRSCMLQCQGLALRRDISEQLYYIYSQYVHVISNHGVGWYLQYGSLMMEHTSAFKDVYAIN